MKLNIDYLMHLFFLDRVFPTSVYTYLTSLFKNNMVDYFIPTRINRKYQDVIVINY